jgi:hypothetical protein
MVQGPQPQKSSYYRRDFIGRLDILRVRIRFKMNCLDQKRKIPETKEQLTWALQELDRIQIAYEGKMPWPAGGLVFALQSWPADSDLREDLSKLEKEYYACITKPPR